jgi:hypothetical protein
MRKEEKKISSQLPLSTTRHVGLLTHDRSLMLLACDFFNSPHDDFRIDR